MPITYGSVCSGIEAATLARKPLGMRATWFAASSPASENAYRACPTTTRASLGAVNLPKNVRTARATRRSGTARQSP